MTNLDSWVRDLAIADSTREILTYEKHTDPTSVLKEESLNLMIQLNILFFEHAETFNSYLKGDSTPLKVLGIIDRQSFIVFRNNYRLLVSIYEPGVILFTFDNFSGNLYSQLQNPKDSMTADEIYNSGNILVGQLGPFNEIRWLFEDQAVDPKKVVRHYFTEFIKASTSLMKNAPLMSITPGRRSGLQEGT